jgi:hypothetical protein
MAEVDGPQLVEHLKLLVGQVFVLDLCVMGDKGGMQERGAPYQTGWDALLGLRQVAPSAQGL